MFIFSVIVLVSNSCDIIHIHSGFFCKDSVLGAFHETIIMVHPGPQPAQYFWPSMVDFYSGTSPHLSACFPVQVPYKMGWTFISTHFLGVDFYSGVD